MCSGKFDSPAADRSPDWESCFVHLALMSNGGFQPPQNRGG